jgi:hypothetical protein
MPQTQKLFPKDDISKPEVTAYPVQKIGCDPNDGRRKAEETALLIMTAKNNETVKYFDLVTTAGSADKSIKSDRVFTAARRNKKSRSATSRYFLPPPAAIALPAADSVDPQEWFGILLLYLDQIVYIKEMSENFRKLEAAVCAGKIDAVSSIAASSVGACAHCGMFESIEMMRRLACVKNICQLADAADLCRQIKQEFERFRFSLKENLEQMVINNQRQSLN